MDEHFDYLINRALDVSSAINITVKLFSMFIVIKYTPKDHRYHSYFVLHIMFWNLVCNLMFAFMHLTPLYPAECMRLDGLSSLLIDSESFGHAMFLAELTTASHCTMALVSAFAYRYIVYVHPHFTASTKPYRVMLLCCGLHVVGTILLFPLGVQWTVSYDDYPEKAELPARTMAFCFYPHGFRKIAAVMSYMVFAFACVIVGTVFAFLILLQVRREKHVFHSQTAILQRKLFLSLLIIAAIAIVFGGIPFLICILAGSFPHVPYARHIAMASTVFLANHGTIYSVTYLILFKAYRDAVKRIFWNFRGNDDRWSTKITSVHSSFVTP